MQSIQHIFHFFLCFFVIISCNNISPILDSEPKVVLVPSTGFLCANLRGGLGDDNDAHTKPSRLLHYWLDDEGKRVYTVRKVDPFGRPTLSAYPARFSPRQ